MYSGEAKKHLNTVSREAGNSGGILVPAMVTVRQFLEKFKEYPPSQPIATITGINVRAWKSWRRFQTFGRRSAAG